MNAVLGNQTEFCVVTYIDVKTLTFNVSHGTFTRQGE